MKLGDLKKLNKRPNNNQVLDEKNLYIFLNLFNKRLNNAVFFLIGLGLGLLP